MGLFRKVKKTQLIVDFSGHGEHKFAVKNVKDPSSYEEVAWHLLTIVQREYNEFAERGDIAFVLPGFSQLAITFIAVFHGFYGYFPRIYWYVRDEESGKFVLYEKAFIDPQRLRYDARKMRDNIDLRRN